MTGTLGSGSSRGARSQHQRARVLSGEILGLPACSSVPAAAGVGCLLFLVVTLTARPAHDAPAAS